MKILVTGGTGFVAGWCIQMLLERGDDVRTTARSLAKEFVIRALFPDAGTRLEVVAADLMSDDGWAAAMDGVDGVLHVASPMGSGGKSSDPDELIRPAREGALRVLGAAAAAGVPRVVMTSSGAAATPPNGATGVFDEALWTNPDQPGLDAYRRSKAIAERAAWDFMAQHPETGFTTVLPGAIFGPILSADSRSSVDIVARMMRGMPAVPHIGMQVVDVRDVADLHLRALTQPEAADRRFLAVGGFLWMRDVAAILRRDLGASKAPTRELPDWAVRMLARFQPELGQLVPMLGRRYSYTTTAALSLGWHPHAVEQTIVDCGRSLVEFGVIAG